MATVMRFGSPPAAFPLGSVFESLPEVTVELERMVPHDQTIVPYFWVRGAEVDDIEAAFETRSGLTEVELIDSVGGNSFLRASWDSDQFSLLDALADAKVVLLSGVGSAECWNFEVRGESQTAVRAFREACRSHGIQIEIKAVHSLLPVDSDRYELTETQQEALLLAYERGYFDSPRTATLDEIAAELGITQQSLSSRLRRGLRRLIANTLARSARSAF